MARSYCFTINNYTTTEQIQVEECTATRYLIYGLERGENGTPHLQGYLEMSKPQRISFLKKLPGFERAHFEARRGTREQAREYCMKEGEWIETGDWAAGGRGARNDIKQLMTMVNEGHSKLEIIETAPETYARNMRFMDRYQELREKEETREFRTVEVQVLVGDAGCGKTRQAHTENPGIFTVNPGESFPFDGYDGESAILIDDFYGDLRYHEVLRILDGHQYRVNVKGHHRYARWTKVVITSNKPPEQWYRQGLTPALKRRLTTVTTFCNEEAGNTVPPLLT